MRMVQFGIGDVDVTRRAVKVAQQKVPYFGGVTLIPGFNDPIIELANQSTKWMEKQKHIKSRSVHPALEEAEKRNLLRGLLANFWMHSHLVRSLDLSRLFG
jgi:hypothetical protein